MSDKAKYSLGTLKVRDERHTQHTTDLVIVDCQAAGDARQVAFVTLRGNKQQQRADAHLFAAAPELLEACEAQELVDEHVANCEDCSDGAFPELCSEGFPIADNARLLRRAAIAKATGETATAETDEGVTR